MAKDNESTMKWKVDVTQLKAAMQDAKRAISLANAEFKTATAGMDKWSKSSTGLEAKLQQLNKLLPQQQKVLQVLEAQYENVVKTMGANSSAAQKLKIEIEEQKATITKTETSINTYNKQLDTMRQKEKEASTAMGHLSKTIADQEAELSKLKKAYSNAVLQYGENSKEAKDLAKQIQDLSGELADNRQKYDDAKRSADNLDKSLEDSAKSAKDAANGGFTILKGALANLVTQGINLVIDGLKNLGKATADAWKEFDDGFDIIISKTGATGDAAKDLQDVYRNVSKQVVGSFEEMGTAVGEVNTRFGVTGDDLEDLSVKFLKFAKLNGTDVNSSIDSVQAAMAAWGLTAEDAGYMLDVLNKAGQDTGVSVDALADSLKKYAPALQEMGFSTSDAAMFLANLDKNGIDASAAMTGLQRALTNAAKEGKPMSEALAEMEDSIKSAKNSTDAIAIATELFGAKSGAAIAKAVRDGKLSFEDLGTSMKDFEGSVNNTFEDTQDAPDKFALAIQGIKTDMADMADALMDKYAPQIEDAIESVKDIAEGFFSVIDKGVEFFLNNGDAIIGIITGIATATAVYLAYTTALKVMTDGWMALSIVQKIVAAGQAVLNAVMAANPIGIVIALIAGLVAAFVVLWNKSEAFREFWINLWESIKEITSAVVSAISEWFSGLWASIQEKWDKAKEYFSGVWKNIKEVFSETVDWFKEKFENAWEAVKNVFSKVGEFFGGIWETIKEKFTNIGQKVGESIGGVFKAAINGVLQTAENVLNAPIRAINSLIGKIKKVPGLGGLSELNTFSLPRLAQGGVLRRGQVGLLEGSGDEAVVPLDQNKAWIAKVVKGVVEELNINGVKGALGANIAGMNGSAQSGFVQTQNVTFNQYNTSPKALDRLSIYRDTNSLLFSAKVRLQNV